MEKNPKAPSPSTKCKITYRLPLLIGFIGIIISVILFYFTTQYETKHKEQNFAQLTKAQSQVFNGSLNDYIYTLKSIKSFFHASNYVDNEEFKYFTRFLKERSSFEFVKWLELDSHNSLKTEYYFGEHEDPFYMENLPPYKEINSLGSWVIIKSTQNEPILTFLLPIEKNNDFHGVISMGVKISSIINDGIIWDSKQYRLILSSHAEQSELVFDESSDGIYLQNINKLEDLNTIENPYKTYSFTILDKPIKLTFIDLGRTTSIHIGLQPFFILLFSLIVTASLCFASYTFSNEKENAENPVLSTTDAYILNNKERSLGKDRYQFSIDASNVGLWDWDLIEETLYWSKGFKEMLGINDLEFIPSIQDFNRRIHPDDVFKVHSAFDIHIKNNEEYQVEYRILNEKNEYVWVLSRGEAIKNTTGNAVRMSGSINNITDRKRYEIQLDDANTFQKLIFDSNPNCLFVKDSEFRILLANKQFLKLYPKEMHDKVIGFTTLEKYDKEESHAFLTMDRLAFSSGFSRTNETITTPAGHVVTFDTQKIRFENSQGDKFILGVAADITEKENLINELVDSNQELEQFAYICSHDLQEPLRMVRSFSEKIASHLGDEIKNDIKLKRYLDFVTDGAKRSQLLVTEILEYSKIGQSAQKNELIDLNELVHNIAKSVESNWLGDKDKLPIIEMTELPSIHGNKTQFYQLLQNLINNGIKYQHTDSIPHIKLTSHEKQNNWIITVTDNGIGIEKRHLTKIFDIFKRLHRKDEYTGTGIGLAICKKVIERHNGMISVDSEVGKGSTFTVTLPII